MMSGGDEMASSSLSAIINEIKQDVSRIGTKIARGVATVAFQDLQTAHTEIMNSFYAGYTPVKYFWFKKGLYPRLMRGYQRTNNLRNNSIIPQGVEPAGEHSFWARVQVGSANMNDYVNCFGRTFPASGVFDLVWNQGIRGLPPGYDGHVGEVNISASPVGVGISGHPGNAMDDFVEQWGAVRGVQVIEMIAGSV